MASRYGRCDVIALYASATAITRESRGMCFTVDTVGISLAVHPLVMVAHDGGDVVVRRDLSQNPLAND